MDPARRAGVPGKKLGDLDSNQDKQYQKLLCYRYTIAQLRLTRDVPVSKRGLLKVRAYSAGAHSENPTDHTDRGSGDLATIARSEAAATVRMGGTGASTDLAVDQRDTRESAGDRRSTQHARTWTCRSRVFPKSR